MPAGLRVFFQYSPSAIRHPGEHLAHMDRGIKERQQPAGEGSPVAHEDTCFPLGPRRQRRPA